MYSFNGANQTDPYTAEHEITPLDDAVGFRSAKGPFSEMNDERILVRNIEDHGYAALVEMHGPFNQKTCVPVAKKIMRIARMKQTTHHNLKFVVITIDSYGGITSFLSRILTALEVAHSVGIKSVTICLGAAYSCGGALLLSATHKAFLASGSMMMLHDPRSTASGEATLRTVTRSMQRFDHSTTTLFAIPNTHTRKRVNSKVEISIHEFIHKSSSHGGPTNMLDTGEVWVSGGGPKGSFGLEEFRKTAMELGITLQGSEPEEFAKWTLPFCGEEEEEKKEAPVETDKTITAKPPFVVTPTETSQIKRSLADLMSEAQVGED